MWSLRQNVGRVQINADFLGIGPFMITVIILWLVDLNINDGGKAYSNILVIF